MYKLIHVHAYTNISTKRVELHENRKEKSKKGRGLGYVTPYFWRTH